MCRSQALNPSDLMQKHKFLDVIFKIFLVFGWPQKFFGWKVCRLTKKFENHWSDQILIFLFILAILLRFLLFTYGVRNSELFIKIWNIIRYWNNAINLNFVLKQINVNNLFYKNNWILQHQIRIVLEAKILKLYKSTILLVRMIF